MSIMYFSVPHKYKSLASLETKKSVYWNFILRKEDSNLYADVTFTGVLYSVYIFCKVWGCTCIQLFCQFKKKCGGGTLNTFDHFCCCCVLVVVAAAAASGLKPFWPNGLSKSFMNPAGVKRSNTEFQIKSQCSGILTFLMSYLWKRMQTMYGILKKTSRFIRKSALRAHFENIWLR